MAMVPRAHVKPDKILSNNFYLTKIFWCAILYMNEKLALWQTWESESKAITRNFKHRSNPINKTNDLILNLSPENMTQHSRIERQLYTKEAQHPLK